MREILFRGKQKHNGKWVEGFYYHHRAGYSEKDILYESAKITTGITVSSGAYGERTEALEYEVIPETVGQYTGLTDKNGKKVFEGDIIGYADYYGERHIEGVVKYGEFNCSCCDGVYGWYIEGGDIRWFERDPDDPTIKFEVIGNICDNPELLEDKDDG